MRPRGLKHDYMITSNSNSKIRNIIKLCTGNKARREQNAFVAEGVKMFMEAPLARIREVYVREDLADKITQVIDENEADPEEKILKACFNKLQETGFETVSRGVFDRISDTVTPQGILCVIEKEVHDLAGIIEDHKGRELRVLVVENVRDPGNIGTMIRTMEAAGYDLLLASRETVDIYNPKVIRSTMGSVYRIPVIYSEDLIKDVCLLKEAGVKVYAAHLKGRSFYDEISYPDRVAVMIGNEAAGLSDEISALADEPVRIPMQGQVESLNAAVAAALFLFITRRK